MKTHECVQRKEVLTSVKKWAVSHVPIDEYLQLRWQNSSDRIALDERQQLTEAEHFLREEAKQHGKTYSMSEKNLKIGCSRNTVRHLPLSEYLDTRRVLLEEKEPSKQTNELSVINVISNAIRINSSFIRKTTFIN